ncbi:SacI homology domain-containing protein [Chytridium lagenaria]|nr:SacI homology domain-containing protein [Chytridium lagenaria]
MMADSSSYDDGGYYYLTQDGETTFGSVRAAPDSVLEEHERVITQSLTRLKAFVNNPAQLPNCDSDMKSLRQIEKRFLALLRPEAAPFILPIVHGFVGSTTLTLDNSKIHIVVVSRIATLRPSILECGVDHNGEAAREVETETMIFSRKRISSFRMVRGSVPLFWTSDDEEDATAFEFLKSPESKEALERHLNMLSTFYGGDIAVVDLLRLDKKIEVTLGRALEDCLLAMNRNDVEYFHSRNLRFKQILKELQRPLSRQQFFSSAIDGLGAFIGKSTSQRGIFRVDCFDGIDFTNIMQYHIALEAISKMLDFMKLPCLLSKTDLNKIQTRYPEAHMHYDERKLSNDTHRNNSFPSSHTRPKEIKNMRTFGAAFIWVALFKVMKKVYPEAMKFRRSSSCAAMFALPTGLQKAPYRSSIADILDAFGESGQKNPAPVRKMSQ